MKKTLSMLLLIIAHHLRVSTELFWWSAPNLCKIFQVVLELVWLYLPASSRVQGMSYFELTPYCANTDSYLVKYSDLKIVIACSWLYDGISLEL